MPAHTQISISAGTTKRVIPHDTNRRRFEFQVAKADDGGGRCRVSHSPDVGATSGICYDPGEGKCVVGERVDCQLPVYVYAVANTVIQVDY
jgi:hypothetical protein